MGASELFVLSNVSSDNLMRETDMSGYNLLKDVTESAYDLVKDPNVNVSAYGMLTDPDVSMSAYDRLREHWEYQLHEHLWLYVPGVLLLMGSIGNVLSLCVLLRPAMRATSTYNYLAALALLDILVLYFGLLRVWLPKLVTDSSLSSNPSHGISMDLLNHSDAACKLGSMLHYTLTVSSSWLLIAVTVDRYIATVHSLHALTMCTSRRAWRVIVAGLICFTVIHSHFFFTMELSETPIALMNGTTYRCQSTDNTITFVERIWPWVDAVLYSFVPFVIILKLNTLIIIQVIKSKRRRQSVTQTQSSNGESTPLASQGSTQNNSSHVTIMLLVVSFAFLICTLPMVVVIIARAFLNYNTITLQQIASYRLAQTAGELLMYTNHSINFYLYLLSGNRFRQELLAMCHWCSHCPRWCSHCPRDYSRASSTTISKHTAMTNDNGHLDHELKEILSDGFGNKIR